LLKKLQIETHHHISFVVGGTMDYQDKVRQRAATIASEKKVERRGGGRVRAARPSAAVLRLLGFAEVVP